MKTGAAGLFGSLLVIRFRQFIRTLADLGVLRVLFLLLLAIYMAVPISQFYFANALTGTGCVIVILLIVHSLRKDRRFLAGFFGRNGYRAMTGEYGLLALPFLCYQAYAHNWVPAGILLGAVLLLPFLNLLPFLSIRQGRRGLKGNLIGLFPSRAFELRSCFRENRLILGAALLAGLVFSRQLAVPLLAIAVITVIYAFSTARNESRSMIESFGSAADLLGYKMNAYLRVLFVSLSPLIVAFMCFHFSYWYLLLAMLLGCCVIILLSIVLKYAFFSPGVQVMTNQVLTGLNIACLMVVYLLPIPFIMLLVYYPRARKHLDSNFLC